MVPDVSPSLLVGIAWGYREWGGAQTHLLCLASELSPRHRAVAFVPNGSGDAFVDLARAAGVGLIPTGRAVGTTPVAGVAAKVRRRASDLRANFELVQTVSRQRLRPHVLHVDMPLWNSTLAILALLRVAPVIQTFHTPLPESTRSWRDRWLRAKFALVTSRPRYRVLAATAATAESLRHWVPKTCSIEIIGVVDLSAVDSAAAHERDAVLRRVGVPPERAVIGSLGQLIQRKGLDTLLHAAAHLLERSHVDLHILLAGRGESEGLLRNLSRELGLADRLTIVAPGQLGPKRSDHIAILRGLDVLALPSRDEGLPLALLEGLALGLPTVASAVGAIPSELRDGIHLSLVKPDSPDELAEALLRLLVDRNHAQALGAAAASHVRRAYDPKIAGLRHEAVIMEMSKSR